jgi:PAP2 superfamily protein
MLRIGSAWRNAWDEKTLRVHFVATPPCLVLVLWLLADFLVWVEQRPGVRLADPLLAALAPRNETWPVFGLIYLALIIGLAVLAFHPRALIIGVQAYVVMIVARICVMYFTPLDPPAEMIPLRDPIVEVVGTGRLLTRDLFFSGHTSTLFLLFVAVPDRKVKAALLACSIAVAIGMLVQHVHYTVDVLVAPLFAFASHRAVSAVHHAASRRVAGGT